jgi:glycosyltransferase involved in cell wall biosynthesis
MLAIETDVLFAHTAGSSSNWLGEFSNTTFRRAMALELVDTSMAGISFAGLEDLGAFLKAGLYGPIGFINDHLGYFRLSAEQNSANPMGRPLKLAFLAYIALAIAARNLGRLTAAQCAVALQRTCPFVLHHYGQQEDMAPLCALMLRLAQGEAAAEAEFLTQWALYIGATRQAPAAPVQPALADPAISLLIPVYNGAAYLAKTLDAVLAQTFRNFEVICIDDGSSDTSLELLQAYAARDARVRVLRTPHNHGCVPTVLNFALPQMRGAYFVYASQDDVFSTDWLACMHARALETGADAVIPDLVFYYENEPQRCTRIAGLHGDRAVVLSGREAAQFSLDWVIPCNALWNAALVQRVGYADFAYNADEYSGRVFFLNCNKVVFSGGEFWYRQDNAGAITKKITYKSFDAAYTFFKLYLLLREYEFPPEVYAKEALKAMRTLEQMQQWLRVAGPGLSDFEREEAQQRAQRCEQALREHGIYDIFASKEATV